MRKSPAQHTVTRKTKSGRTVTYKRGKGGMKERCGITEEAYAKKMALRKRHPQVQARLRLSSVGDFSTYDYPASKEDYFKKAKGKKTNWDKVAENRLYRKKLAASRKKQ